MDREVLNRIEEERQIHFHPRCPQIIGRHETEEDRRILFAEQLRKEADEKFLNSCAYIYKNKIKRAWMKKKKALGSLALTKGPRLSG